MSVFLPSVGSAIMTFCVLTCVLPMSWAYLGSALRAGTGTLTKFTLGDHIIYCTFTDFGEGKPPVLSHVRVSREPQPQNRLIYDDFNSPGPHLQTSKIKSPSYQHKILQFHSNGQTSSTMDHHPTRLFVKEYSDSRSSPVYPVASKFGRVDTRKLIGSTSTGSLFPDDDKDMDDSWEAFSSKWDPQLLPEPEEPTFTPYIGARALTNIPKFFEHLRENIEALHERGRESITSDGDMSSKERIGDDSEEVDDDDDDKSYNSEEPFLSQDMKTPTRRDYSSISKPRFAQPVQSELQNRGPRPHSPFTRDSKINSSQKRISDNVQPDEKSNQLLHFLRRKPEYPQANNYNPGWLFTNLGLGKRNGDLSKG